MTGKRGTGKPPDDVLALERQFVYESRIKSMTWAMVLEAFTEHFGKTIALNTAQRRYRDQLDIVHENDKTSGRVLDNRAIAKERYEAALRAILPMTSEKMRVYDPETDQWLESITTPALRLAAIRDYVATQRKLDELLGTLAPQRTEATVTLVPAMNPAVQKALEEARARSLPRKAKHNGKRKEKEGKLDEPGRAKGAQEGSR